MKLSKQSQSRLEESKVEKRIEDEEYLASHQEITAAIRVISKVRKRGVFCLSFNIFIYSLFCKNNPMRQ